MENFEKCDILKLMSGKSIRLSYEKNKGISEVWSKFDLVNVDGKFSSFVKCVDCHALLKWKSRDGTSGLKSHTQSCKVTSVIAAGLQPISSMAGFTSNQKPEKKTVSIADKQDVTDSLVNFCAVDIRPFSTVEGAGFKEMAGKLIAIGAKYGPISASEVLPCATTISRHVNKVTAVSKCSLKEELFTLWRIAVTSDLWTHESTNVPYITVTVHYLNDKWELCNKILATRVMDEKKTAENIRSVIDSILQEFEAARPNNIFVTDNGSNIKSAFKDQAWISCSGHNINLTISHALDPKNVLPDSPFKPVVDLISTCKEVVTRAKRTQIQNQLTTTLKQVVSTRWNSTLTMLKSIKSNMDELKKLSVELNDKPMQKLLLDVNEDLISDVVKVLEPFEAATKLVSADQTPTLHLVLPVRSRLLKQIQSLDSDTVPIKHLKLKLKHYLNNHFRIHDLHHAAAVLDPRLRNNLNVLSVEERRLAIANIRQMMLEVPETEKNISDEIAEPPAKMRRIDSSAHSAAEDSFFGDLFSTSTKTEVEQDELEMYFECSDQSSNILEFWQSKFRVWPKLANVARVVLAIPATETSSERVFSLAGRTLEERRTQLGPEIVDDLLFLHGLKSMRK